MAIDSETTVDAVILVPQGEEYKAVKHVFDVPDPPTVRSLTGGGTYVVAHVDSVEGQRFRIAIVCMNEMYNYASLAFTERALLQLKPRFAFLVGSACGNRRKVGVLDIVVSNDLIVILGRGRMIDGKIRHRQLTFPVGQKIRDAIVNYSVYTSKKLGVWAKECQRLISEVYSDTVLPENIAEKLSFDVKLGIIATDDLVLTWSSLDDADYFWANGREDARAYDMESGGFSFACSRRDNPPLWAVIRGISDFGIGDKYHRAAAAIAAWWLRGFLVASGGQLLNFKNLGPSLNIIDQDLRELHSLIEREQRSNSFVGKRHFMQRILKGESRKIEVLEYAIAKGGILEYEIKNPSNGRRATAIHKYIPIEV